MMLEWEQHITRRLTPLQRDYLAQLYHACRAAYSLEKWLLSGEEPHTAYISQADGSRYPLVLTEDVLSGLSTAIADLIVKLRHEGLDQEAEAIVDTSYRDK
jgi:hypothetical protein